MDHVRFWTLVQSRRHPWVCKKLTKTARNRKFTITVTVNKQVPDLNIWIGFLCRRRRGHKLFSLPSSCAAPPSTSKRIPGLVSPLRRPVRKYCRQQHFVRLLLLPVLPNPKTNHDNRVDDVAPKNSLQQITCTTHTGPPFAVETSMFANLVVYSTTTELYTHTKTCCFRIQVYSTKRRIAEPLWANLQILLDFSYPIGLKKIFWMLKY